jgi:ketosteroid isomerase-like protein
MNRSPIAALVPLGVLLVAPFLLGPPAFAATIDRQAALDAVVAAERAFARAAAEKGFKASFLEYLADDALMMMPTPRPAKESLRGQPESPMSLSWYPVHADVSRAGDLGYTTGPFERRAAGPDDPNVGHGFYVSVWRKQPDGSFRVVFDLGTLNEAPARPFEPAIPPARPATVEEGALPKGSAEAALEELLAADRAFAKRAEQGTPAAYAEALAPDARYHRHGRFPAVGREAIRAALREGTGGAGPRTWEPTGGGIARSADLGYTYGVTRSRQNGPESPWVEVEAYLRIWKREPGGAWKVVLDVADPLPPPAGEE